MGIAHHNCQSARLFGAQQSTFSSMCRVVFNYHLTKAMAIKENSVLDDDEQIDVAGEAALAAGK